MYQYYSLTSVASTYGGIFIEFGHREKADKVDILLEIYLEETIFFKGQQDNELRREVIGCVLHTSNILDSTIPLL